MNGKNGKKADAVRNNLCVRHSVEESPSHSPYFLLSKLCLYWYYKFPQKLSKIAVADDISHRHGGVLVKVFN